MEKRQLDFNAPLLSARRFSSPRNSSELAQRKLIEKRPPPARHEWESEDITKPASVPFHWERTPGRPKNEAQIRLPPSNTPRLPPGRLSGPSKFVSGERSNDHNIPSFSDHASLLKKLDASVKCKDKSDSETDEEGNDTFSDALDASGISGYHDSGVKPSGKFCVNQQTRDFMMNRFLPAAKAAVIETPQYAAKKTTAVSEEVKEVKNVFSEETVKPLIRSYGLDAIVPFYGPGFDDVNSEDEDKDSIVVPIKKPGKSWGILPRNYLRSTLCLLNSMPGMKSKSRPPTPSAGENRRLRRNSVSGPLDKAGCQLPPKKKYYSGLLPRELEKKTSNDSYPLLNSRESPQSGLSPLRRYRSGSTSPYRNESPKREGPVGFHGVPIKELESFNTSKISSSRKMFLALQDVSKNQINERVPSLEPTYEHAVYIDSVNKPPAVVRSDKEKYADEVRDIKRYLSADREPRAIDCGEEECDLPLKTPLPPPLPKSPSESWLWRTLPSFGHSRRSIQVESTKKQGRKGGLSDETKWETIVKSSKLRHDHARYTEELVPHASYGQNKSS